MSVNICVVWACGCQPPRHLHIFTLDPYTSHFTLPLALNFWRYYTSPISPRVDLADSATS